MYPPKNVHYKRNISSRKKGRDGVQQNPLKKRVYFSPRYKYINSLNFLGFISKGGVDAKRPLKSNRNAFPPKIIEDQKEKLNNP